MIESGRQLAAAILRHSKEVAQVDPRLESGVEVLVREDFALLEAMLQYAENYFDHAGTMGPLGPVVAWAETTAARDVRDLEAREVLYSLIERVDIVVDDVDSLVSDGSSLQEDQTGGQFEFVVDHLLRIAAVQGWEHVRRAPGLRAVRLARAIALGDACVIPGPDSLAGCGEVVYFAADDDLGHAGS